MAIEMNKREKKNHHTLIITEKKEPKWTQQIGVYIYTHLEYKKKTNEINRKYETKTFTT